MALPCEVAMSVVAIVAKSGSKYIVCGQMAVQWGKREIE